MNKIVIYSGTIEMVSQHLSRFKSRPVLVILFVLSLGQSSWSVNDVLTTGGNIKVLTLMDLHLRTDSNGNCVKPDNRAFRLAHDVIESHAMIGKSPNISSNMTLGLALFDTCGSSTRALTILSQYFSNGKCNNENEISYVISYVAEDVRNVIRYTTETGNWTHVAISNQFPLPNAPAPMSKEHIIHLPSMYKMQALFDLLNRLNWTYLSTLGVGMDRTGPEIRTFKTLATKHNICIKAEAIIDVLMDFEILQSAHGTVVFATGLSDREVSTLLASLQNESGRFIVYTDANIAGMSDVRLNSSSNVLLLLDDAINYLDSLNIKNTTSPLSSAGNNLLNYWTNVLTCSTKPSTTCSDLEEHGFNRSGSWDAVAAYDAVLQVYSDFDNAALTEDKQGELTDESRINQTVAIMRTSGLALIVNIRGGTMGIISDSLWNNVSVAFSASHCPEPCPQCMSCLPWLATDVPYMNSNIAEADIAIGAYFSIHKSDNAGLDCATWSWEGLQATEAFAYAVETMRTRHPGKNVLPGINISPVMFDSCGKGGFGKILREGAHNCILKRETSSESTREQYPDISAYVTMNDYIDSEPIVESTGIPLFTVSKTGIVLDNGVARRYVGSLKATLKSLDWTYVNVVYSKVYFARQLLNAFQSDRGEICLASITGFQVDNIDESVSTILRSGARAVVLITTVDDTKMLLNAMKNSNGSSGALSFVSFPWNEDALQDINYANLSRGSVMIAVKEIEDVKFSDHLKSLTTYNNPNNSWWRSYHEFKYNCYTEIADGRKDKCLDESTIGNLNQSTHVPYIIDVVDLILFAIDTQYKNACPHMNGKCEAFSKIDIRAAIRNNIRDFTARSNQMKTFSKDGELIVPYDIVNYQQAVSGILLKTVGEYKTDNELVLSRSNVKSYNTMGEAFVALSQCQSWCPQCAACNAASLFSGASYYSEGDVIIAGLFPVHAKGNKPFTCGDYTVAGDSDQIIEAFMHAVSSAKTRYEYLLPEREIGVLVIDTCDDGDAILRTLADFETCNVEFQSSDQLHTATPKMTIGYVSVGDHGVIAPVSDLLARLQKPALFSTFSGQPVASSPISPEISDKMQIVALVDFLLYRKWNFVPVIVSENLSPLMSSLINMSLAHNICIPNVLYVTADNQSSSDAAISWLQEHRSPDVVVVLTTSADCRQLMKSIESAAIMRTWLFVQIDMDIHFAAPLGSLVLSKLIQVPALFSESYMSLNPTNIGANPWFNELWQERFKCSLTSGSSAFDTVCTGTESLAGEPITTKTADVTKSVDILLHGLHDLDRKYCAGETSLCHAFAANFTNNEIMNSIKKVSFWMDEEHVKFLDDGTLLGIYGISNYQKTASAVTSPVQIGVWNGGELTMDLSKDILLYDHQGNLLQNKPNARCTDNCQCLYAIDRIDGSDTNPEGNQTTSVSNRGLLYWTTSGQYNNEIWTAVVICVAGVGVLITAILMVYVLHKVCKDELKRRYIALGLLLMTSLILLHLSVLAFVYTPSNTVCGLRFVAPGLAYAMCFGIILVKMMSLREYKFIGLGGEVSSLNHFLTIFFIVGVQIAIYVQWWVNKKSLLLTEMLSTTMYACNFERNEFVLHLTYVMILIVVCAFYGLSVRKEHKNMGEVRFLLASTWLCVLVWVVWTIAYMLLAKEHTDITVCVGVLVCATLMLCIIYVPKIYFMSRLKYNISKKRRQQNGYKVDPDFLFERPYTLPGTMLSTYSDKYPPSYSTYDSSFQY